MVQDKEKKQEMLKKRNQTKKPDFILKESKFVARIKKRWRFPRGKHSAVRQRHKGRQALPTPGYGAPSIVRGLHPSGFLPILVNNKNDLLSLNKESEAALISGNMGIRKKVELLNLALENKINILNVKDIPTFLEKVKSSLADRKKGRQEKMTHKKKKEEDNKKKAEEKEKKEKKDKEDQKADKDMASKESVTGKESKLKTQKEVEKEKIEKTITKRQ